jgi:hypothetical protein
MFVTMLLRDEDLEQFIAAHKDDTGENLSMEEAREIAGRLLELYRLLARPLPKALEERAKQLSGGPNPVLSLTSQHEKL